MRRFLSLAAFALLSVPLLSITTTTPAPSIHVFSCQVVSSTLYFPADQVGLVVRFRDDAPQDLASIVWRAPYEFGYIDFTDDGSFSQGVRIDSFVVFEAGKMKANWGNIINDVVNARSKYYPDQPFATPNLTLPTFMGTEDPQNCTVVRTIAKDGELWLNPAVSQSPPPLLAPTPHPIHKRGEPTPTAEPTATPSSDGPVLLYPCFVGVSNTRSYLTVHFVNQSTKPMTDVVFRAPYGSGTLDFEDSGSFAPGIDINHYDHGQQLDVLHGRELYAPALPQQCDVVRVTFSDGTAWQNPAIIGAAIAPTPIPDQLVLPAPAWIRWSSRHTYPTPFPSPNLKG
jgi:hypothetical protein